jgi:uncharacterized protein (DUF2267 family)
MSMITKKSHGDFFTQRVTEELTITVIHGPDGEREHDVADHVRTALGPLLKDLDLPRIHVMAEGHRVLLHGDVASAADAIVIEDSVLSMPSVDSVESHLHVGLIPGDTRPSEGVHEPSEMYRTLFDEAALVGLTDERVVRTAIAGVLTAILNQVPPDERSHVIAHFPHDVAKLAKPRRHIGEAAQHWHTVSSLETDASLRAGISLETAVALLPKVILVLRVFVPEEDHDVQACLTRHLREYWIDQMPDAP